MIAHHKQELTEENVNDYDISLNPENIDIIHFRCHNLEHERFEGFRQRVFLVYGSPCSGKSSFVREQANGDDLILDVDRIWDAVCLDGRKSKPGRMNPIVFRIRDEIIDAVRTRTGKWRKVQRLPTRSSQCGRFQVMVTALPLEEITSSTRYGATLTLT